MEDWVFYGVGGLALIYVIARVVSFAYFQAKMRYQKTLIKELQTEVNDEEGPRER